MRIYGKIAFNFLAYVKGVEFVQQQFDIVRDWIANGGDYDLVRIDNSSEIHLIKMGIELPTDAHVIYYTTARQGLISQIFLYGGFSVMLMLSEKLQTRAGTDVFISD